MDEPGARLLLVDDERSFRETMVDWLTSRGFRVTAVAHPSEALTAARETAFAVAVLDVWMPGANGLELLAQLKELSSDTEVVMLTGAATVSTAIEAIRCGAFDYLTKPVEPEKLANTIHQAHQKWRLSVHARELEREIARSAIPTALVGRSPELRALQSRVASASKSRGTVLIRGETGSGKELVARAIHDGCPEPRGPFLAVNCAAIPRDLIESELFGHRKGAFTGADNEASGLFVAAGSGTLLLDEVTEMSPDTQAKLLRVIQEKRVRPVGATAEVPVECRIVASTNRDPAEAIRTGKLREDLYYRLSVATILVPPLRNRRDDIPLLVRHFLDRFQPAYERRVTGVARAALAALMNHSWPGNVRELENAIEQAFMFGSGPEIKLSDLPPELAERPAPRAPAPPATREVVSFEEAQRAAIRHAIQRCQGNKSRAAVALGISRKHLYSRMKALGLEVDEPDPE